MIELKDYNFAVKGLELSDLNNFLCVFQGESNRIEQIETVYEEEITALRNLVKAKKLSIDVVCTYLSACEPSAQLRDKRDLNVRIGKHFPIAGGPMVKSALVSLLNAANEGSRSPYMIHLEYEILHPFTDGNGRTGRAIWLWQMMRNPADKKMAMAFGFLHAWYYQSLDDARDYVAP